MLSLKKSALFFTYLLLIIIISFIFIETFISENSYLIDNSNNILIKKIPFGYGSLIYNIINSGEYLSNDLGLNMNVSRLPMLPMIISTLIYISKNIYFVVIVKNIIFFSIYYFCVIKFVTNYKLKVKYLFIFLIIILYNPYNLVVSLNFVYADFITALLIPCLFLMIISNYKNKFLIISILIFALYLSKTNMFFLTILFTIAVLILEKDNKKYFVLIGLFLAVLFWSSFGFLKTGKIPIGQSLISINSWGMSHVLNKDFSNYYPYRTVDQINFKNKYKKFTNEWEFYDFYNNQNIEYLKKNKLETASNILVKANFIFFNIYKTGSQLSTYTKVKREIRISNIPNKMFLNLSIIILIFSLIVSYKKSNFNRYDIYFVVLLVSYLLPLLIGWATNKHLIGLFILSKIYILYKYILKKNIKSKLI